ncbi:hypothetical protein ACJDU8_07465 [Clostridium sp. WILCCON 0269]|uniref:Uncharacterized protein n=1 Tax=Candidatus Clostridium eludens TaxID=3381663 RepID=A0ABW8SHP2_9CLOT
MKVVDMPPVYYELFINKKGDKLVVRQSFDEDMTRLVQPNFRSSYSLLDKYLSSGFTSSYPKGTKRLEGFGEDLALLIDLQKGRKQLKLYHKEKNNQVTLIEIFGCVDNSILKSIAHSYLNSWN